MPGALGARPAIPAPRMWRRRHTLGRHGAHGMARQPKSTPATASNGLKSVPVIGPVFSLVQLALMRRAQSDAAGADRRGDHRAGEVREADGGDLVEVWTDGGRAHATPLTITRSQKSTSGWKTRPAEATLLPVPVGNLILSRNIRPCGKGTIASSTQRGRSNTATVKGSHAVEHALERPLRRDFGLCP